MKLSIIIVNYNVKAYLRQCLISILASTYYSRSQIIVVDNNSSDKSCEMIKDEFPEVTIIKNKKNIGFSKAANLGINQACGDYLCFLNPDTLVKADAFEVLINYIESNPNTGCIGPKILNADGTFQLSSKRSFPTIMNTFYKLSGLSLLFPNNKYFGKYNLTYLDEDNIHNVDSISGAFMLLPKKVVDEVGLFDESFFMFGEDLDYCYRIKKNGYSIIFNPSTSIIHYKGESVKTARIDMVEIFYSSMSKFYKKYSKIFPSWKLFTPFILFGILSRKIFAYFMIYLSRIISWIIDLLIIVISFFISHTIWFFYYHHSDISIKNISIHFPLLINIIICWIVISYYLELYKKHNISYERSIISSLLLFLLSATSTYFIGTIAYSRVVLIFTCILITLSSALWRIVITILYRHQKLKLSNKSSIFSRRTIILGTSKESIQIAKMINNLPGYYFLFLGYVGNKKSVLDKYLGKVDEINNIIRKYHINEIIIPQNWGNIEKIITLLNKINHFKINCNLVPQGEKLLIGKGKIERLEGIDLISIEFPLFQRMQLLIKRVFDFILSFFLILLTLPFHVYYYFTNKMVRKSIWGQNNNQIIIYYYSSHYTLIQELPLLIMILLGDLTFVGSQIINTNCLNPQLIVKPGLTGLPHLNSNRESPIMNRKYEYFYASNYSLVFDIEIIIKSIFRL